MNDDNLKYVAGAVAAIFCTLFVMLGVQGIIRASKSESMINWQSISTYPELGYECLLLIDGQPTLGFQESAEDGIWYTFDQSGTLEPTHWAPRSELIMAK